MTPETIQNRIFEIRGQRVMLDFDLAALYQVTTSALNQSVKRNAKRFPSDFMFQLNKEEFGNLKSQFVTSSWGGTRRLPYAFTEQGLAMLSGLLNSDIAINVNISIMRAFVVMRNYLQNGAPSAGLDDLRRRIKALEQTTDETPGAVNDLSGDFRRKIDEIYFTLSQLAGKNRPRQSQTPRRTIGFRTAEKE